MRPQAAAGSGELETECQVAVLSVASAVTGGDPDLSLSQPAPSGRHTLVDAPSCLGCGLPSLDTERN